MIYKRALFVAFIVTIIGLGVYMYSSNQIALESSQIIPNIQWFYYQEFGMVILGIGIALFIAVGIKAIQHWIRW